MIEKFVRWRSSLDSCFPPRPDHTSMALLPTSIAKALVDGSSAVAYRERHTSASGVGSAASRSRS